MWLIFVLVLAMCASHYLFFYTLNERNPHKVVEFERRHAAEMRCIQQRDVEICGPAPEEVRDSVAELDVSDERCEGRVGLVSRGAAVAELAGGVTFHRLERWCDEWPQ